VTKGLSFVLALAVAIGVGLAPAAEAQGLQTGTLSGVVQDPDGLPVPGATVTATSPALQGERSTVTDAIGAYIIRGLPPGTYAVRFELSGTATVEETVSVPLGGVARVDPTLRLAGVTEAVTVTADITPSALASTQNSTNLRAELLNTLPVGRRPFEIAELAPGVTDNTPNVGQMAISGSFAFDSIFLIDGVDTNDNLFGTSTNLFVEDAILETQVLTSGISAEYGRFGGGVVNVITRSGGNDFSGSFRANFARPSWTKETPFERERNQNRSETLSKFFEGTIGGPIVRDRLWFFNADRYEKSATAGVFAELGGAFDTNINNKRFELKLTGTPITNHRVSGSFLNNPLTRAGLPAINATMSMTAATLINRRDANRLWVANWNGALSNRVFGTFQWSRKDQSILDAGGTSTTITDSPFLTRGVVAGSVANRHFNAPYFSANDPENRNNRQFAGSASYYMTNPAAGRHDLKVGFEHFKSFRTGGNSQSATGYVFQTDYLTAGGRPVVGADGEPIPLWGGNAASPSAAPTRIQNWLSVQGAQIDIKTLSLYAQDRWTAGDRLTFDLGVRYEKVRTDATGGLVGADTDTIVPRLGASFDVTGNGRLVAQATYARYSGRFTERAFARNTNVGTPSLVTLGYTGPTGQGFDFAPGFDLRNYAVISGNFPTANVFFDEGLTSPKTDEFTLSLGREFGRGSYAKAIYTWRNATDFIEDFIDDPSAAGKIAINQQGVSAVVDRVFYANTGEPRREYQDVQLQSRVRFTDRLFVEGHWTVQLRNHGNFEGEAANQPGNPSIWFDYPEIINEPRYFPFGRLDEYQRHKVRIWTSYTQRLGRLGNVDLGPIWRINSGQSYSLQALNAAFSPVQLARRTALGYLGTGRTSADLFFDERGSESFKGYALLDLQIRYGIPVWRTLQPWYLVQIYNVLNNDKLIQWTTAVTPDPASPLDDLGQRTGALRSAAFGTAGAASHFPRWSTGETGGRTFRMAFGIRF
jgi:outer membrane receptor protein involved in Fe transport